MIIALALAVVVDVVLTKSPNLATIRILFGVLVVIAIILVCDLIKIAIVAAAAVVVRVHYCAVPR